MRHLLFLRPFQDYFTYFELIISQRFVKTEVPGEKPPDLPLQNLTSDMWPKARLKPTAVRDLMIKRQCLYPLGQQAKSQGNLPGTKSLGTSDEWVCRVLVFGEVSRELIWDKLAREVMWDEVSMELTWVESQGYSPELKGFQETHIRQSLQRTHLRQNPQGTQLRLSFPGTHLRQICRLLTSV